MLGLCAVTSSRDDSSLSCSSATFPSLGPNMSRESRKFGEEVVDKLEADDFDM